MGPKGKSYLKKAYGNGPCSIASCCSFSFALVVGSQTLVFFFSTLLLGPGLKEEEKSFCLVQPIARTLLVFFFGSTVNQCYYKFFLLSNLTVNK
jgi:hypothetical protein